MSIWIKGMVCAVGMAAPLLLLFIPSSNSQRAQEVVTKPAISEETLNLVKNFEGYSPTCVDWLDGHATIGYGHLLHFGPCTAADQQMHLDRSEALRLLRKDLLFFQRRVRELVRVPINKEMEAALISFAYNVGDSALVRSTLLRLLNDRQYLLAAGQFDLWIHGPNGPLPGLIRRRAIEKEVFTSGGFSNRPSRADSGY